MSSTPVHFCPCGCCVCCGCSSDIFRHSCFSQERSVHQVVFTHIPPPAFFSHFIAHNHLPSLVAKNRSIMQRVWSSYLDQGRSEPHLDINFVSPVNVSAHEQGIPDVSTSLLLTNKRIQTRCTYRIVLAYHC